MNTAQTILDQIRAGRTSDNKSGTLAMMCWAARNYKALKDAFAFRVSGYLFHGNVLVRLEPNDLYTVEFYNTRWKLKKSVKDVFCDQLTATIDTEVEMKQSK